MHNYLFNFSASYIGGGHKRMIEFVKYFNHLGGAIFILNSNSYIEVLSYTNNKYYFIKNNNLKRLLFGESYINKIISVHSNIDFYYSYGIPVEKRIGKLNWLHISNILPLSQDNIKFSIYSKFKNKYLGYLIKKSFNKVNYISAESKFSLSLVDSKFKDKLVLSVNGADDELLEFNTNFIKEEIAIVIGTLGYKAINESFLVFKFLQKTNKNLKLYIIGNDKFIPNYITENNDVITTGLIDRSTVIQYLKKAKYYISNTKIENSYNAASEGIFFAEESFISNIPVHLELLNNSPFNHIKIEGCSNSMLNIKKHNLSIGILVNWSEVISDVINTIK